MSSRKSELDNISKSNIFPKEFKQDIVNDLLLPYYKQDILQTINSRNRWSYVSNVCLTISTILIGTSSIFSFSSTSYPNYGLSFIGGSLGVISLVLKEFSSYANKKDHKETLQVNNILSSIGIDIEIPDDTIQVKE